MKVPIDKLKPNDANPRRIRDESFKKLLRSITDFPEMAEAREIVVNKDYVILGGNQRYRAMKEAGWKEVDIKMVDWTPEQQQEFIIRDNVSDGDWDWDLLANEWDEAKLVEWNLKREDWSTPQFEPNIEPGSLDDEVTKAEIERKAKELADQMMLERENVQAICPNCGEEFKLKL